jgi:hypothetical protein
MTLVLLLWPVFPFAAFTDRAETARYLRPADQQFQTECDFSLTRSKAGSTLVSATQRGKTKLTVTARYDDKNLLTGAEAVLVAGDDKKIVTVVVKDGKAMVQRAGQPMQEFDVPAGVVVTSAPDWTDAWLLCRRVDRAAKGKQQFPGLWIHPVDPAQRLTFAIERQGTDTIEHAGKKVELDRFTIWLRGNSAYAVWADAQGRMIKLAPLPFKDKATNGIVLEGYEKSARNLKP